MLHFLRAQDLSLQASYWTGQANVELGIKILLKPRSGHQSAIKPNLGVRDNLRTRLSMGAAEATSLFGESQQGRRHPGAHPIIP